MLITIIILVPVSYTHLAGCLPGQTIRKERREVPAGSFGCRQGYSVSYTHLVLPSTVAAPSSRISRWAGELPQSMIPCRKAGQR